MIKIIVLFTCFSFCFTSYNTKAYYQINLMGLHVADCFHSTLDTVINDLVATKISYKVKTIVILDYFFKVNNEYEVIMDKKSFKTLYFKKTTSQPKIKNNLETSYKDNLVIYPNNTEFKSNEINIFGVLHLININQLNKLKFFKLIDREGKKYKYSINNNNNLYQLELNAIDNEDRGNIVHTDIFTWGLFLSESQKYFYKNKEESFINKCVFKKGLLKITAEIKNPN